jgi:protease-4
MVWVEGTLATEPIEGLRLHLYGNQFGMFGGGLLVTIPEVGVGLHAQNRTIDSTSPLGLAYFTAGEPGSRLLRGRKLVPEFDFVESYPYQPNTGLFATETESYLHLLGRLEQAATDPSVQGVVIHLDSTPFSFAQIEELRGSLERARERGKTIVAHLDRASSSQAYLLACGADQIYLHPAADLDLVGLSIELQFLRGTLDLVGVEPQFARRSEYKGAVESYMRSESSTANQEQLDALLDDMHSVLVLAISQGRGKSLEEVARLIDDGPYTAEKALEAGLIDGTAYPDALSSELEELFVDGYELAEEYGLEERTEGWRATHEIAVIYVDGVIVPGNSAPPGPFSGALAGSDTIVRQLDEARSDDAIKAVILRVDSPGGSSFASDEIWHAVEQLTRAGKPVVVSMGGMAASGGYYVSAGATSILALNSTITGSIGVYGGKLSFGELYEKVGIHHEIYARGRNSAMYTLSRPFDPVEFEALDELIGEVYRQFKEKVEIGREMTPEKVEEVARGRVWSGRDAQEVGLVDAIGGFDLAIRTARIEAEIPERATVELVTFEPRIGLDGSLVRTTVQSLLRPLAGTQHPWATELGMLGEWQALAGESVWTIVPYRMEVR